MAVIIRRIIGGTSLALAFTFLFIWLIHGYSPKQGPVHDLNTVLFIGLLFVSVFMVFTVWAKLNMLADKKKLAINVTSIVCFIIWFIVLMFDKTEYADGVYIINSIDYLLISTWLWSTVLIDIGDCGYQLAKKIKR